MSVKKALDILEEPQPHPDSKVKRGPVVIAEEDADWLSEWIKRQKVSGRSRA